MTKLTFDPDDFQTYLRKLLKQPAHWNAYLASRNWQLKRQALGVRSNGKCERCEIGRYEVAHHLTYDHRGSERMYELQAICRRCHDYLHGRSDRDPAADKHRQGVLNFN